MSLWKNTDANTSAPIYSPMQVNLAPTQENVDVIYENTTQDVAIVGRADGVFGVDNNETIAQGNGTTHAGWVLRTEGSGGRSGRVFQETLVAMGSMNGDSDDTTYPDSVLRITSQPGNKSVKAGGGNTATFTVGVTATPDTTISYQWQVNNNVGGVWVNVANGTPTNTSYSGGTTATLTVIPTDATANAYVFRAIASATGATNVTTANATILIS